MGRAVGYFEAGKGVYVLDLDVLQDGSRLNGGAPRLVISEATYEVRANAGDMGVAISLLSLLLAVVGTYLIIRPALWRRREERAALARRCSLTQTGPQPRDLRTNRELPATPIVQTGLRPPVSACVGAVLILAALAAIASIQHWISTRNLVALDMPVSLAPGHLRTGPFRIDSGGYYVVSVDIDDDRPYNASCGDPYLFRARWVLYRDGQVADGADRFIGFLGGFEGDRGVYDLDLEVLNDAGCLNSAHPRLRVIEFTNAHPGFTSLLLWLSTSCMGAGAILLAIGGVERFRKPPPPVAPCIGKGTAGAHFRWKRRPLQARPFSGISHFGLIAAIICLLVWISIAVLQSCAYTVPTGLRIHLMRPGIFAQRDPGIQPVLFRAELGESSGRPSLYVDSRPVSWDNLGEVLQKELNQRPPNWPVYFEGDPAMDWQWAVKAIDTIRGLHAEVVLLTSAHVSPPGQSGSRTTPNRADTVHHGRR